MNEDTVGQKLEAACVEKGVTFADLADMGEPNLKVTDKSGKDIDPTDQKEETAYPCHFQFSWREDAIPFVFRFLVGFVIELAPRIKDGRHLYITDSCPIL